MKKVALSVLSLFLFSCAATTKSTTVKKPLYEVLTQQQDGGGNIRFFEIISDNREFTLLKNDENLKNKVKPNDIDTSNFLILNLGEKEAKGYTIEIEAIEETQDKIIVTIKEQEPKIKTPTEEPIYPYTIIKINSKKEIIFK